MKLNREQTELLKYIENGDLDSVKHLILNEGVNPNFGGTDYTEKNPICHASLFGQTEIAFFLIKSGKLILSEDIFRFVTNVIGDISTSNLLEQEMKQKH